MLYFIVNPASQSGKGKKLWNEIECILINKFPQVKYSVCISEEAGDLGNVFNNLKKQPSIETLVLVGGDGTINEAINCIDLLEPAPMIACLPCGTSNDFIRSLKLPNSIESGLNLILSKENGLQGKRVNESNSNIDVCWASLYSEHHTSHSTESSTHCANPLQRLFVNGLGSGYDGEIIFYTEKSKLKEFFNKIGISKLMYIVYGLRQAFACKPFDIEIEHDGIQTNIKNCYMVTPMVNPFEGGGIYFAPKANASDGLTDLIILHSKKRIRFIYNVLRALLKLPAKAIGYTDIQFKKATVKFSKPQIAQIDGESIGAFSKIEYVTIPKYFTLLKD